VSGLGYVASITYVFEARWAIPGPRKL